MNARVFAALELPHDLRQGLASLIANFRALLPRDAVRWVRPEGIHLTLKFYGEVDTGRLPDLQAALARAAGNAAPISLAVESLGVFPNPIQPRVIWAGVHGDLTALRRLQKSVDEESARLGFQPEARGFSAHLTLGRVNGRLRPDDLQALTDFLSGTAAGHLGAFQAGTLSLMRSELRPGGSIYTSLFAAVLG